MVLVSLSQVVDASRTISVNSLAALNTAIANAEMGDEIVLANGTYVSTGVIKVENKKGMPGSPIIIRAETIGGVTITGEAGIDLEQGTQYVTLQGFVFKHKAVTGRGNSASHSKITRNVYELTPNGSSSTSYLKVFGDSNEVSYNTFRNKKFKGPILSIQGEGTSDMSKGNWVHHNHFIDFPNRSDNDNTAIQPGYHARRHSKAYLLIEHNLFERMNADAEGVLSAKCHNVTFRYNTIYNSRDVNLRNGNEGEVYGNYFFGGSGIRFSGTDHKIYNNTFVKVGEAIKAFSRKDNNPDHDNGYSHQRPDRSFVGFNTMIESSHGFVHGGDGGSKDIRLVNNLFVNCKQAVTRESRSVWTTPVFEGNIIWKSPAGDLPNAGFKEVDPLISIGADGIPQLKAGSPAIGAAVGNYTFVKNDKDGQPRADKKDVGSDQFSNSPVTLRPLKPSDVGPGATANTGIHIKPSRALFSTVRPGAGGIYFESNAYPADMEIMDTQGRVVWSRKSVFDRQFVGEASLQRGLLILRSQHRNNTPQISFLRVY